MQLHGTLQLDTMRLSQAWRFGLWGYGVCVYVCGRVVPSPGGTAGLGTPARCSSREATPSSGLRPSEGLGGWGWDWGLGHELRGSLACLYRKLELCHEHEH